MGKGRQRHLLAGRPRRRSAINHRGQGPNPFPQIAPKTLPIFPLGRGGGVQPSLCFIVVAHALWSRHATVIFHALLSIHNRPLPPSHRRCPEGTSLVSPGYPGTGRKCPAPGPDAGWQRRCGRRRRAPAVRRAGPTRSGERSCPRAGAKGSQKAKGSPSPLWGWGRSTRGGAPTKRRH